MSGPSTSLNSALDAPRAGWGDTDLYPDSVDKAAVLVARLVKNHPLPDGNKRAAWVTLRVFIELNDWRWRMKQSASCSTSLAALGTRATSLTG